MTGMSFETLGLSQVWLDNLDQLGYTEMTPIQARALPSLLDAATSVSGAGGSSSLDFSWAVRIGPKSRPTRICMNTNAIMSMQ